LQKCGLNDGGSLDTTKYKRAVCDYVTVITINHRFLSDTSSFLSSTNNRTDILRTARSEYAYSSSQREGVIGRQTTWQGEIADRHKICMPRHVMRHACSSVYLKEKVDAGRDSSWGDSGEKYACPSMHSEGRRIR
jgi:hypothetical protein